MPDGAFFTPSIMTGIPLDRPLQVWLIDSDLPGHTIQVATVGNILKERIGAQCTWIRAKLRVRGPVRSVARWLVDRIPPKLAPYLARFMYQGAQLPAGMPDLIISSSTHTISVCRLFARKTGAPTIFLGELRPRRAKWFDLVIAPTTLSLPNGMLTPLTQTGQTPSKAAAAAEQYWPNGAPKRCWSMVIGGDGRNHTFRANEWKALGDSMNRAAREHNIRWLISTSRRTRAENEAILQETIDPSYIQEAIWWATNPKRGLAAYLHAGERAFVTRDSLTMVSEAIAIKGHVEVVYPSDFCLDAGAMDERYLKRLEEEKRLTPHPVTELSPELLDAPKTSIEEEQEHFIQALLAKIETLLQPRTDFVS